MKVKHYINGSPPVDPTPVIEWQLTYSSTMEGPMLQGRNPNGTWQNVLCIDSDGLLDPTYRPGIDGLQLNGDEHIACVSSYKGGEE